ncbi:MAG: pyruvate synthase subunit PorD [Myxococcota bacterium]
MSDKNKYLPGWTELAPGTLIPEPGSAGANKTGDWRSFKPEWDHTKCVKCGVCYVYCPDAAIYEDERGYFLANLDYCKGCGICAVECWTACITMREEEE